MPPLSSQLTELPNPRKPGIPCPECGVYFDTRASLLSHMSKQHKDHAARPVNQPKREFDKHTDALGGLPRCSHCHVKLCDFSSLRKHINEHRCRVLFPTQPLVETPTQPHPDPHKPPDRPTSPPTHTPHPHSDPQSTQREPMNHSNVPAPVEPPPSPYLGPTTLTTQEDGLPYFRRPHVQALLLKYSENAAFRLQDRRWLRHYCALCSQWIACASKVKQHYRLSHQLDHEQYMLPASRLCSKFNTPASPCEHCGATIQASHPAKCTVLWQISLMHLKLQADRNGAGAATGSLRPLGDGTAELHGVGAGEKGSRAQLGPFRSQQSLANGTRQGAPVAAGPHKQTTLAQRWWKGTPLRWPQSDLSDQGAGLASTTTGDGDQDPPTGLQLGALRPTGQSGTATTPLRSGSEMEEVTGRGSNNNRPSHYTVRLPDPDATYGPEGYRRSGTHTIPDQSRGDEVAKGRKLVEALQLVLPIILQPYMIHRFHATRPLAGNMTGVTTFQLDISNRTKGHNTVWECMEALTGLSALQIIGLQLRRDTLKQSLAAALVQQPLAEYS